MTASRFTPRRPLGRTGFHVTALGIGDLADGSVPFDQLVATARRGLDAGLNLIDTARCYDASPLSSLVSAGSLGAGASAGFSPSSAAAESGRRGPKWRISSAAMA